MANDVNNKLEFIYASIVDQQSTIRAIDNKVNYLLVMLIIPLTKLNSIFNITRQAIINGNKYQYVGVAIELIVFIFAACWVTSFIISIRAIVAIDNPFVHVKGNKPTGVFYGAYLYSSRLCDSFINRKILSTKTVDEHLSDVPNEPDGLLKEIAFEHMKLVYIRTMKLSRQKYAYILGCIWIVSGGFLWLIRLML